MLISNFGVAKIYRFLNLLLYVNDNRNEKLNLITTLGIDAYERIKTLLELECFWIKKCQHWRVKSVISFDHKFQLLHHVQHSPVEPDLLKPVLAGSGCRLLLDGLVTRPSSKSGSESPRLRLELKINRRFLGNQTLWVNFFQKTTVFFHYVSLRISKHFRRRRNTKRILHLIQITYFFRSRNQTEFC